MEITRQQTRGTLLLILLAQVLTGVILLAYLLYKPDVVVMIGSIVLAVALFRRVCLMLFPSCSICSCCGWSTVSAAEESVNQ
jgi:hypothetical protein